MQDQQPSFWQEMGRYQPQAGGWASSSHITYLTFKSLLQLRRTMNTGVVMLDCKEQSLATIAEKMVDELVRKKEIRPGDRDGVLNALIQNRRKPGPYQGSEMHNFSVKEKADAADSTEDSMVIVGSLDFLEKPAAAFVRLKEAVALDSALEAAVPVRFVFVLIVPGKSDVFNQAALQAQGVAQLMAAVTDFMDFSVVIPPTEIQSEASLSAILGFQKKLLAERLRPAEPPAHLHAMPRKSSLSAAAAPPEDPLARTGRPFGGMMRDIRRRYQHYRSDITDALNSQVLAAVIFIYFAALSPAITFGGLLADKVDNMMGVSELLISTSVQGIVFCFVAAQPVLVIGFSGPLLVFEEAFFAVSKRKALERHV
ncbi:hypothetical protein CRUP_006555 [Coryphaenoides rupestris]|nr:hypothetical protein CRUP_006555 [Coryphaenoides rupestris]